MYKKEKKSKFPLIFWQIFFTIFATSLIVGLSLPLSKKLKQQYSVNKEIKTLKEEISRESSKNNNLKQFIEYLNSDEYVQEKARTNLNYRNENEKVVVVKDIGASTSDKLRENFNYTSNIVERHQNEKIKNAKNWLKYFFN